MLCIESRREKWYHLGNRRNWNEAGELHEKNSGSFGSIDGTPTTAFAVSLDGKRLDVSRRVLFTHLTDVQADGSVFSDSTRTLLYDWGKGGCVACDGKVEVRLSIAKPERCTVYALGTDGNRKCRIKSRIEDGSLLFTANVRQPFGACFHYEIESSD